MGDIDDMPLTPGADVVKFFTQDPHLTSRRLSLDVDDLIHLVGDSLVRRGMPISRLTGARWVWRMDDGGTPVLVIVYPGLEA